MLTIKSKKILTDKVGLAISQNTTKTLNDILEELQMYRGTFYTQLYKMDKRLLDKLCPMIGVTPEYLAEGLVFTTEIDDLLKQLDDLRNRVATLENKANLN
jgi:polyhydroxyalkanoate synthesis regulator phasin